MSERETEGLIAQAEPWPKASDLNDAVMLSLRAKGTAIDYFAAQRRMAAFKALRGTDADRRAVAFIDEAISALATRAQTTAPTCQKCGGEIAGWLCQRCPAEFRENDDGVLIFDDREAPENAERVVVKTPCEHCLRQTSVTPESLASYRDTIGAQPQARPWGWDYKICTGCSASLSIEEIAASGKVSCCPDRRMVTVRELVDAYEARTTTKAPLSPPPPSPSRG